MYLSDLLTIVSIYEKSEGLKEVSLRKSEIISLAEQAQHWDKKENDRKWFHF